jgi:hypothetical protein
VTRVALLTAVLACAALSTGCNVPGTTSSTRQVVVYSTERAIWIARPDGEGARFFASGRDPVVSPDGRYVAYVDVSGGWRAEQVLWELTTGGPAHVAGVGDRPEWAPNSEYLAFDAPSGFTTLDIADNLYMAGVPEDEGVAFSPDSTRFAFAMGGAIWVIPTYGGSAVRLSNDHNDSSPVWGKAGIAFFRGTRGGGGDIWLTRPRRNAARQLTHTGDGAVPFAFSADGTKLLAGHPRTRRGRLWAVDIPSGRSRALSRRIGIVPAGLSTSGTSVLAVRGCGRVTGRLVTIPFAGGEPDVIASGICHASWNER